MSVAEERGQVQCSGQELVGALSSTNSAPDDSSTASLSLRRSRVTLRAVTTRACDGKSSVTPKLRGVIMTAVTKVRAPVGSGALQIIHLRYIMPFRAPSISRAHSRTYLLQKYSCG